MHNPHSRDQGARSTATDVQPGRALGRFDGFDGLRALAAGLVLLYHLSLAGATPRMSVVGPLISATKAGVTIFFVISGFLLYLPYARAIRSGGPWPGWRTFAKRRAVRILPAYWVALSIIAVGPVANGVLGSNWWRYYGLVQIYSPHTIFGGIGVAWSLCVEVTFYALLPVFAWAVAKLTHRIRRDPARLQLLVAASLAVGTLVLRLCLAHSVTGPVSESGYRLVLATSLPGLFDWFAIGIALAVIVSEWEAGRVRFRLINSMVARPAACWLLAGLCFSASVIASPLDLFLPEAGVVAHVLLGVAAALLVLPATATATSRRRAVPIRVLTNPRMVWLGTISYGIYLWHDWFLKVLVGPLTAALHHQQSPAVGVLGAVVLGAASWYLVEAPAQRLFNRARGAPTAGGISGKAAPTHAPAQSVI